MVISKKAKLLRYGLLFMVLFQANASTDVKDEAPVVVETFEDKVRLDIYECKKWTGIRTDCKDHGCGWDAKTKKCWNDATLCDSQTELGEKECTKFNENCFWYVHEETKKCIEKVTTATAKEAWMNDYLNTSSTYVRDLSHTFPTFNVPMEGTRVKLNNPPVVNTSAVNFPVVDSPIKNNFSIKKDDSIIMEYMNKEKNVYFKSVAGLTAGSGFKKIYKFTWDEFRKNLIPTKPADDQTPTLPKLIHTSKDILPTIELSAPFFKFEVGNIVLVSIPQTEEQDKISPDYCSEGKVTKVAGVAGVNVTIEIDNKSEIYRLNPRKENLGYEYNIGTEVDKLYITRMFKSDLSKDLTSLGENQFKVTDDFDIAKNLDDKFLGEPKDCTVKHIAINDGGIDDRAVYGMVKCGEDIYFIDCDANDMKSEDLDAKVFNFNVYDGYKAHLSYLLNIKPTPDKAKIEEAIESLHFFLARFLNPETYEKAKKDIIDGFFTNPMEQYLVQLNEINELKELYEQKMLSKFLRDFTHNKTYTKKREEFAQQTNELNELQKTFDAEKTKRTTLEEDLKKEKDNVAKLKEAEATITKNAEEEDLKKGYTIYYMTIGLVILGLLFLAALGYIIYVCCKKVEPVPEEEYYEEEEEEDYEEEEEEEEEELKESESIEVKEKPKKKEKKKKPIVVKIHTEPEEMYKPDPKYEIDESGSVDLEEFSTLEDELEDITSADLFDTEIVPGMINMSSL